MRAILDVELECRDLIDVTAYDIIDILKNMTEFNRRYAFELMLQQYHEEFSSVINQFIEEKTTC